MSITGWSRAAAICGVLAGCGDDGPTPAETDDTTGTTTTGADSTGSTSATTTGVELVRGACAIDAPKTGMRVERAEIPAAHIVMMERIAQRTQLDVGGIEYLLDERDGQPYVYDVNALSNFVADAVNVVGFDPFARLADYLLARRDGAPARAAA